MRVLNRALCRKRKGPIMAKRHILWTSKRGKHWQCLAHLTPANVASRKLTLTNCQVYNITLNLLAFHRLRGELLDTAVGDTPESLRRSANYIHLCRGSSTTFASANPDPPRLVSPFFQRRQGGCAQPSPAVSGETAIAVSSLSP